MPGPPACLLLIFLLFLWVRFIIWAWSCPWAHLLVSCLCWYTHSSSAGVALSFFITWKRWEHPWLKIKWDTAEATAGFIRLAPACTVYEQHAQIWPFKHSLAFWVQPCRTLFSKFRSDIRSDIGFTALATSADIGVPSFCLCGAGCCPLAMAFL